MTMTGKMDAGRHRVDGGQFSKIRTSVQERAQLARWRKTDFERAKQPSHSIIQLPFTLQLERPLKSRLEVEFAGDTAVQVFDGKDGWKLRPFLGRHEVEPFTPAEKKIAALAQPLDGPLIDYRAKGTKVAVMGGEKVNGHDAYKLELTLKNGSVRHVWVDAKTFLDIKVDGAMHRVDGKMRPEETYLGDYRRVDGVMVPYLYETHVEGRPDTNRIQVEQLKLNTEIADSRFAKPE
jgi:outer membrane lipoprotein-sorting protein